MSTILGRKTAQVFRKMLKVDKALSDGVHPEHHSNQPIRIAGPMLLISGQVVQAEEAF